MAVNLRIYYRIRCGILQPLTQSFQTSTQPSTTFISDNININMDVILVLLQTTAVLLLALPTIHGCSCAPQLDTAIERANDIINTESINLVVIASFTNETTYIDVDENRNEGPPELETQNTSFMVSEILYNRYPNSSLQNSLEVQSNGTKIVRKSTITECCICGRYLSPQDIGNDYLITINRYGDSLSICDHSCRLGDDGRNLCNETANELRRISKDESSATRYHSETVHVALSLFSFLMFWANSL